MNNFNAVYISTGFVWKYIESMNTIILEYYVLPTTVKNGVLELHHRLILQGFGFGLPCKSGAETSESVRPDIHHISP